MTECNSQLSFGFLGRQEIVGRFEGGDISSDGGLFLLREADEHLGLTAQLSGLLHDQREPGKARHQLGDAGSARLPDRLRL